MNETGNARGNERSFGIRRKHMDLGEIGSSYSRMWKNKKVYFKNQKYEIDIGKPPHPKRDKGNST